MLSTRERSVEASVSFVVLQNILPVPYFASERSFAQFRLSEEVRHPISLAHGTALQCVVLNVSYGLNQE